MNIKMNGWRKFVILILNFVIVFTFNFVWAQQKEVTDKEKYGGTLTIGVKGMANLRTDNRYMSPLYRFSSGQQEIYEPLYAYGEKGTHELIPVLAVSWRRIDDKTCLVTLRKGVRFHNGREMTAEDVKANYDWLLSTPKGWMPITVQKMFTEDLKAVEVVDKYTVKFILKRPSILFEWGII